MIRTLAAKELKTLFVSPRGWLVLAVMQAIMAYLFLNLTEAFLEIQPRLIQSAHPVGVTQFIVASLFSNTAIVLLMVTPLLTMGLIAGERRQHTLALLLSSPASMTEIVLGKFLGLMVFFSLIIGLLVLMALALFVGSTLDIGLLVSNVVGLWLLVACFIALGLYLSSLTASPTLSAMSSLGAFLGLWLMNLAVSDPHSLLHYLSPLQHFDGFNRGLISTQDIVYFMLFIGIFLTFTIRRLDADRLRG